MTSLYRRSHLLRVLATAILSAAVLFPAGAMSQFAQASAPAASAGTLTIGITNGIDTWDASVNESTLPLYWLEQPVYDTLIRENVNGKYVPGLATHWSRPNPKTFVMTIRTGVKFQDGTPLNAAAVKANIDHSRTDKGNESALVGNVASVQVVNATTVRLNLSAPDPDLESTFARFDEGAMISPKAIKNPSELATAPDGTGPYTLNAARTVANDHYTFTRKKSYWGGFSAFPYSTVVVKIIPNDTSLLNATVTGQVDFDPLSNNTFVSQAKSGGLQLAKTPAVSINVIGLLDRVGKVVPAMKDVRVRQALNYAIDRKSIIGPYFNGYGVPTSNVLAPTVKGYDKKMDNYYAYNPTKAKQLLTAAGYANGFSFTLLTVPFGVTSAEIVAGFLKKIGVTMNIHTSTNFSEFYTDKWESIPGTVQVPSAYTMVQKFWQPNAFFNPFHADDPTIIALAKKAALAKGSAQTSLMKQINDRAEKDAYFIVMGGAQLFYAYSKKLSGVQVTKRGNIYFYGWHPK